MQSLTTQFQIATLRFNLLFLDIFLQWYLYTTSVEEAGRHHKRNLQAQNRAHNQQRSIEQKLRKQQLDHRLGL